MLARADAMRAEISIHSLVKRETQTLAVRQHVRAISIHSLVKRETGASALLILRKIDFNPLPRKEGDTIICRNVWSDVNFNPLPRKEGDHPQSQGGCSDCHFNPLPRKEGDGCCGIAPHSKTAISIHSLVKRETSEQDTSNFVN